MDAVEPCIPCRRRRLHCNGAQPCERCQRTKGQKCTYRDPRDPFKDSVVPFNEIQADTSKLAEQYALPSSPQSEDNYWTHNSHPSSSASSVNSLLRHSVSDLMQLTSPVKDGTSPQSSVNVFESLGRRTLAVSVGKVSSPSGL